MYGYLEVTHLLLILLNCTGTHPQCHALLCPNGEMKLLTLMFFCLVGPCRLCIAFLTFSCIGYAMPFILCATICCCLPCLISVLGFRENFSQTRGATAEAINALPVYKFKSKSRNDLEFSEESEGGFLLLGSQKKRLISGEDAVSKIPLRSLKVSPWIHST